MLLLPSSSFTFSPWLFLFTLGALALIAWNEKVSLRTISRCVIALAVLFFAAERSYAFVVSDPCLTVEKYSWLWWLGNCWL